MPWVYQKIFDHQQSFRELFGEDYFGGLDGKTTSKGRLVRGASLTGRVGLYPKAFHAIRDLMPYPFYANYASGIGYMMLTATSIQIVGLGKELSH